MSLTDYYIQKKVQGGDIREFERLFTKYYGPMCHHAEIILKDMDTAEDLVQEFFYQFWKNRESLNPKLSLKAYLHQSIRNNAFHHLRHLEVRKRYAEQIYCEFQEGMQSGALTETELNEISELINATLEHMPDRCSRIFRMNRFEGLKYREIANILSISVKTVEAEMSKALQLFRISLKDYIREGVS